MSAARKVVTEPAKTLFYGYFYIVGWLRRALGRGCTIRVVGGGHTRPYLTWKVFRLLGAKEVADGIADVSYLHVDETMVRTTSLRQVLNSRCIDIRKSTVARLFEESFGYPLAVDPRRHVGPMVEKSERNAAHDGRVVDGPLENPKTGCVYQLLIDNSVGAEVVDFRPCIVGSTIPFVYVKRRPIGIRFSNDNASVDVADAHAVFDADEIAKIVTFSGKLGLDIGELDILRDGTGGRIYIVDAAKTPHSPSDRLISAAGIRCMHLAARAFREEFLEQPGPA